jgi:hypothetical protein
MEVGGFLVKAHISDMACHTILEGDFLWRKKPTFQLYTEEFKLQAVLFVCTKKEK